MSRQLAEEALGAIIWIITRERDYSDAGHKRAVWLIDRGIKFFKRHEGNN